MADMLPDLADKSVLDLGCGYGHNCVDFIKRGAKKVAGIDISSKMIEVAKKESGHPNIEYVNMSMTDISLIKEKFDLIYSSLAFHYIENFAQLVNDINEILNTDGEVLYSQEHHVLI